MNETDKGGISTNSTLLNGNFDNYNANNGLKEVRVDKERASDDYPPFFSLRSVRLWICLMLTSAMYICQSMNVALGMSIVCMVNSSAHHVEHVNSSNKNNIIKCQMALEDSQSAIEAGYTGDLLWTPSQQTLLFSASVYGAYATIFYSGYLADRFGPKLLVLGAIAIFSLISLLTPLAANYSYTLFFFLRIILGLGDGFMFPCAGSLAGKWFPSTERSTAAALYTSGRQMAASLTSLIASNLCASSLGWPSIFYLFGSLGTVFLLLWYLLVSSYPASHACISEQEKRYLASHIPNTRKKSKAKVPWRRMLTSPALIAAVFCNFTFMLLATLMQQFLMMFLKEQYGLPLQSNGVYTMMPFLSQLIFKNVSGAMADYIKRKRIMTETNCSKVFQIIASVGSSLSLLALLFLSDCESSQLALIFLFTYGTTFSAGICGFFTSLLSIAPSFSGTIMSISMCVAYFGQFLLPNLLTIIVKFNIYADYKWHIIMVFCAVIHLISGANFLVHGSADVQEWAKQSETEQQFNENENEQLNKADIGSVLSLEG